MAERIRAQVERLAFDVGQARVNATVSIGLARSDQAPASELTSHGLLNAADKALYQAKAAGRNCVV